MAEGTGAACGSCKDSLPAAPSRLPGAAKGKAPSVDMSSDAVETALSHWTRQGLFTGKYLTPKPTSYVESKSKAPAM